MKNYLKFNISYNIDYILLGIRTKMEDYQFAYFLNTSSFFLFSRIKKDISSIVNNKKIYFSVFKHADDGLKKTSFLIKNKSFYDEKLNTSTSLFGNSNISNTAFLIPELKEFDYFIKLIGVWKPQDLSELSQFLKNLKNVEPEININLTQIKSINNLVF